MPTDYTHKSLDQVKDSAPEFGYGDRQEARFATGDLEAEATGLSHHRLRAGQRQPFGHRHDQAEEVYIILSGSGRVNLDGEIVAVERLDAVRVSPGVTRAFEAGTDGLEVLAVGPHHEGDGELISGWWGE